MSLKFSHEEIVNRYESFVSGFLSEEIDVNKLEILPRLWFVEVPQKNFKVSIECKLTGHWHGIEEWCAIVTEPNGETSNYLLFEKEIEEWASEQRRLRGLA